MPNAQQQFKDALEGAYLENIGKSSNKGGMMLDMLNYSSEMKENEKLRGGLADDQKLLDIAMKHAFGDKVLTTGHKISSILGILKSQLKKGIQVELEHTKDEKKAEEIALDHLIEDLHYYSKLKKMENKEQLIVKPVSKKTVDKFLGKEKKLNKPVGKITSLGKKENKEATGSGSAGQYSGPVFGGNDEFWEKSNSETKKLEEGIATGAMGIDKVEAKEATGSGSVGGYESPSMWAKSTKKKDWGPSRKTQIPGGGFVKVKKKCTRFPYCNQGDINALKITKNESVKEAIKKVSKKTGIKESVIITILEYEYEKSQKRVK